MYEVWDLFTLIAIRFLFFRILSVVLEGLSRLVEIRSGDLCIVIRDERMDIEFMKYTLPLPKMQNESSVRRRSIQNFRPTSIKWGEQSLMPIELFPNYLQKIQIIPRTRSRKPTNRHQLVDNTEKVIPRCWRPNIISVGTKIYWSDRRINEMNVNRRDPVWVPDCRGPASRVLETCSWFMVNFGGCEYPTYLDTPFTNGVYDGSSGVG